MRYKDLVNLSNNKFKRLVGVKKQTFDLMIRILSFAYAVKHEFGGKPDKLGLEEKLLMSLCYWREYRTFAHIGMTYGYSESQAHRIIRWCEDVLIKSGKFTIGGKKELLKISKEHLILIDVTESPVERPKKNRKNTTQVRKKGIQLKHN